MFWQGNHDTFWTFKPRCSYTESNTNSFSNRQYYIVVARQPHQKKDIFFWDRLGTRKQVYLTNLSWEANKWIREVIKVYLWDWWVCWDISGLFNCFCLQDQKVNEENIFKELLGKSPLLAELEGFFFLRDSWGRKQWENQVVTSIRKGTLHLLFSYPLNETMLPENKYCGYQTGRGKWTECYRFYRGSVNFSWQQ